MDDLMKILPEYFRPVREFKELMAVEEVALRKIEQSIKKLWGNFYIQTADETTVTLLESGFNIICKPGETLEYRRQRLLQKYSTVVPFSEHFLKSRLAELFGDDYQLTIDSRSCLLTISVTSSKYGAVELLYDLLWDVMPAHMEVIANQQVNNYIPSAIFAGEIIGSASIQII